MARHYATRDFFRQMPNQLLARYFHARGVFDDLDITALPEPQPDALWAAWLTLDEVSNRPREIVHLQIGDLFVGDQADHRSRSPVLNRVEVGVEIPLPGTGYCVAIDPTGALREADPAPAVAQGHRRDAEWVALGGSCHRHGLYSLTGFWHHRETDLCASISLARYPVS